MKILYLLFKPSQNQIRNEMSVVFQSVYDSHRYISRTRT